MFAVGLAAFAVGIEIIVPSSSEKHMVGVDARWNVAFMAKKHAIWNWAVNPLPQCSMGAHRFSFGRVSP